MKDESLLKGLETGFNDKSKKPEPFRCLHCQAFTTWYWLEELSEWRRHLCTCQILHNLYSMRLRIMSDTDTSKVERRLNVVDYLITQIKSLTCNEEYYSKRLQIAEKCPDEGRFDNAWWHLFDCPDEGESKFYIKLIEEEQVILPL